MRAGVVRAEGVITTAAQSADRVLLQRFDSIYGQYIPREITVSDLLQNGITLQAGSNEAMGTATLVAGTITVANTRITANSRIFVTVQALGTVTAPKAIAVTAKVNGVSFTITSEDNTDTSQVAWLIVEGA